MRASAVQKDTPSSVDFVIAGATGDLTRRKLIPALLRLFQNHKLPANFTLIGAAYPQLTTKQFRAYLESGVAPFLADHAITQEACRRFMSHVHYVSLDIKNLRDEGWKALEQFFSNRTSIQRIFYLATSSRLYCAFMEGLRLKKLTTPNARIALEKPIGHSQNSAQEINQEAGRSFSEENIFRIDHYLGKEGVQNIFALRAGNPYIEALWSSHSIASVQITAAEELGVEDRHSYYDEAGALRDMVQNHLLQMLCLVGMELPSAFTADQVHNEKIKFLRTLPVFDKNALEKNVVRGQYDAGVINGHHVPSYQEDMNTQAPSNTETFVALRILPQTPRWKQTPFYLRTGKRLARKTTEIVINFRHNHPALLTPLRPSYLVIHIAPHNKLTFSVALKNSRHDNLQLQQQEMTLDCDPSDKEERKHAYESILLEILEGNTTLFPHREEINLSWQWIETILQSWQRSSLPIPTYKSGSWGPAQANALVEQDSQQWLEAMLS